MDRDKEKKQQQQNSHNKHKEQHPTLDKERGANNYPLPSHAEDRGYHPYQDLFKPPYNYSYLKNYQHPESASFRQYPMSHLSSRDNSNPYQIPMQQNYPYGYPYSYPGMSYPYSMYPPYYSYRPDPYPDLQHYGYPYQPAPPNHTSASVSLAPPLQQAHQTQPHSPPIKQQIVISSDEDNNRYISYKSPEEKAVKIQQRRVESVAGKKVVPFAAEPKQEGLNNDLKEEANPFYIKHKRIEKESKSGGTRQKRSVKDRIIFSEEKILMRKFRNNLRKKQEQVEKEKELFENKTAKNPEEKPSTLEKAQPRPPFKSGQEDKSVPEVSDHKKEGSQTEGKETKKEKIRDDHPLKELRYNESHGRIRIGAHFQSSIPEIADPICLLLMRKQLKKRLEERQISALTF